MGKVGKSVVNEWKCEMKEEIIGQRKGGHAQQGWFVNVCISYYDLS